MVFFFIFIFLFFFLQVGFKVFYIQRNGQYKGSQIVRNFPDCRACRANKVCSKIQSFIYSVTVSDMLNSHKFSEKNCKILKTKLVRSIFIYLEFLKKKSSVTALRKVFFFFFKKKKKKNCDTAQKKKFVFFFDKN